MGHSRRTRACPETARVVDRDQRGRLGCPGQALVRPPETKKPAARRAMGIWLWVGAQRNRNYQSTNTMSIDFSDRQSSSTGSTSASTQAVAATLTDLAAVVEHRSFTPSRLSDHP